MSQETVRMSRKERRREALMLEVTKGRMLLKEAAWEMRVSPRQAVRIKARYEDQGARGLVHKNRDMPSNRRADEGMKQKILAAYRERYEGFGPTLAAEKLLEYEGISVVPETLRRWLIEAGLWRVGHKERVHRRRRPRRERFGELVQIDGSDHEWFGDRGPRATLMVMVDDATGRVMLHMAEQETTRDALLVVRKWVRRYGVPVALYADRRTVYFTAAFVHEPKRRADPEVFTDFMKVADRLGMEMIPAYSPQAKGRVERQNATLQDRLVKELRLRNIDTIADANAMLDAFADDLNRRFARPAARTADAHRLAPRGKAQWDYCFSIEETRTVQRDNTVVYQSQCWQILAQEGAPPPGTRIVLRRPIGPGVPHWAWGERRLKTRPITPGGRTRQEPAENSPTDAGASPLHPRGLALSGPKRRASGTHESPLATLRPLAPALGSLPSVALPSERAPGGYEGTENESRPEQKAIRGR